MQLQDPHGIRRIGSYALREALEDLPRQVTVAHDEAEARDRAALRRSRQALTLATARNDFSS